jgi:hypothetical protein
MRCRWGAAAIGAAALTGGGAQIDGMIYFEEGRELTGLWDDEIRGACAAVNRLAQACPLQPG